MLYTGLTFILVALIAYTWLQRNFFSALLHFACTIIAGAFAFALWEPVAFMLMGAAPQRGFGTFLADDALGISLALLFGASVILLRIAVDKLVPKAVVVSDSVNMIGGGVVGLGIGVLTIGILSISLSHLRLKPSIMGYQPIEFSSAPESRGSVIRSTPIFRPYVDEITGTFYEYVSRGTLRPINNEPLGKWHPDLYDNGALLRTTFDEKSRNTLRPEDFKVIDRYTLGDLEEGRGLGTLLGKDKMNPSGRPVSPIYIDGQKYEGGRGHIEGITVRFLSTAKEKGSGAQVVVGNTQIRLLVEKDGVTKSVFPAAVISQGESATADKYRWRYDGKNVFIASVGGASEAEMTFEFAVEHGYTPIAIYVKGVRRHLDGSLAKPSRHFTTTPKRDDFYSSSLATANQLNRRSAVQVKISRKATGLPRRGETTWIQAGIQTGATLGFNIKKGNQRSLQIQKDDSSRSGYFIVDGIETFDRKLTDQSSRGLNKALRVNRFISTSDVAIVKIDVGASDLMTLQSSNAQNAPQDQPLRLYDASGVLNYEAVGYIYKSDQFYKIRYTPADALRGMNDLAAAGALPSQSKPGELQLIFRVSAGAEIIGFGIGNKMLVDWSETPILIESGRR